MAVHHNELSSKIRSFTRGLTGRVFMPGDDGYDEQRLVYNRMHDCRPAAIIQTLDVADLTATLSFCREMQLEIAVRGGGHHIGGFGTTEGGVLIDFSPFRKVEVDRNKQVAIVQPGARLRDVDAELCRQGYVIPTGTVSDTGIAGLTLGGGIGWLVGKYGLTCDHLIGADILLADGRVVMAELPEHQDLLWALRGGGGNFGIVLSFRFALQQLPITTCGIGKVKWENAIPSLLSIAEYLANDCPASLTVAPVLTRDASGIPFLEIDFCHAGEDDGTVARFMSRCSHASWEEVGDCFFPDWQSKFNGLFEPPMRGYWKAVYLDRLTPEIIQATCREFERAPTARSAILYEHLHGALRCHDAKSAFPLRNKQFGILIAARWPDADDDKQNISWVRDAFALLDPEDESATYINYAAADDLRATQTLASNTLNRIADIKMKYDRENIFRRNHNISIAEQRHPLICDKTTR